MKYSIIIPAYNEEAAIKKAVEEVTRYFYALAPGDFEIIIIDDGSRDRTAEITKNLLSSIPEMRLLKKEGNFGKGYSGRRGKQVRCGVARPGGLWSRAAHLPEAARLRMISSRHSLGFRG